MVLSASQVISLEPDWSNFIWKMPASESREPGWTAACGGGGQGQALGDLPAPAESYLEPLEVVSRLPVPEVHRAVVRPGHQHSVGVGGETVDDGVVAREVLDELALGTFPLLDVVGAAAGEHQQLGVGNLGWGEERGDRGGYNKSKSRLH